MRIALLSRSTPAHFATGGMERHLDQVARGLIARGHAVTVITSALPAGAAPDAVADRLRYVYVPRTVPGRYLGGFWTRTRRVFRAEHARERFDAVFSQSAGAWGVMRLGPGERPPVLAAMHGTSRGEIATAFRSQPLHPKTAAKLLIGLYHVCFYTRPLLRRCERVVAVSAAVAGRLEREFPGLAGRVQVIPNGIALGDRPRADCAASQVVLYAGRVIAEKGVFLLLRAFTAVAERFPAARLRYVGGGALDALRREAASRGLGERVEILGPLDHAAMPGALADAGLFALPTLREEGLPLSLLEAMASGLPVLSIARGGIGEALSDGREGRLLPAAEEAGLASALAELLGDSGLRARLGAQARRRVEADFGEAAMVEAYERALLELAGAAR